MNDKKGFTLIELVAVIVIIGILAFLIIPSVASYIVNTKESTYKSYEKAMNEAAESYTIDCISSNGVDCDIPLPNEERNVYLSELIDKEFISKLGDPAKKNSFCNPNISYVKVQNTGDNDFEYLACLYCSIYATENPNCVTYTGDSDKPVCKIIETHSEWTNGSRQVKVGCEDATSGCLRNEFKKTFSTTTDKGIITITDKSGNSTDCEVEVKVDKNLPTCKIVTTDTPINGWYPFGSKFTITDMQDGESGLLTYGMGTSVEADFNKKREYVPVQGITRVFGYVKDNAGNVGTCSINAKVKTRFTVRYDKNNGTGSMPDKICMVDDDCYLDTNIFTRVGYTFDGWNTRADGTGISYADRANVKNIVFSGNVTLYAKWKPTLYSIIYDLDEGLASTDGFNPETYTIETPTFTLYNPIKEHYLFVGWTGTGLTSVSNSVTIPQGSIGDREYTAKWTEAPKAEITCLDPHYTGREQTIATCSGGTKEYITETAAGEYEVFCDGDETHSDADSKICRIVEPATNHCKTKIYTFYSSNQSFTREKSLTSSTVSPIPICSSDNGTVTCSYDSGKITINVNNANITTATNSAQCKIYTKKILGIGTSDVFYNARHCYYYSALGFGSGYFECGSKGNPLSNEGYSNKNGGSYNHCPGNDSIDTGYRRFCRGKSKDCFTAGKHRYDDGTYSCKCYIRAGGRQYVMVVVEVKYDCNAEIICSNKTYNGSQQTIATCSGGTIENAIQKNAGDYIITCTGDENHLNAESKVCSISPQTCPAGYQNTSEGGCTPIIYSIGYNLDGGSVSGNPTTYTIESNAITLNNPTKEGYTFAGWTGTGLSSATTSVTIPKGSTGNRSYTATWRAAVITVVADGFCSRNGACNCDSQATGTCMYTNHNMDGINGQGAYNCPQTHVNPDTGASENLIGVSACGQASAFAEARIDQTGCYKVEMNGQNLKGDVIIVGIHFLKGREHFRTDTETFTKTKIVFYAKISEAASYTFGIRSFPNSGCWMGALGETFNNVVITRIGDLSHSKCANDNVCYYDNNTCTR